MTTLDPLALGLNAATGEYVDMSEARHRRAGQR
jgi:hypothetical protein